MYWINLSFKYINKWNYGVSYSTKVLVEITKKFAKINTVCKLKILLFFVENSGRFTKKDTMLIKY